MPTPRSPTALRASEARFRAVFAGAAIGIGIADMQGRIVQVNPAFCQLLGYSVEEMCLLNVTALADPEDVPGMWEMYAEMIQGQRDHVRLDKAYYRKDGGVVWTDLSVSLVRDDAGAPRFTVAMLTNVTERHRLQQRLRYQALHDPLTGLPNRAMAAERLEEMLAAPDPRARLGLCYLDLDGFKRVNDTLGHHVGDQLLVAVARRLEEFAAAHNCWSPGWAATSSCCWLTMSPERIRWPLSPTRSWTRSPHRSRSARTDFASPPASASSNAWPPRRPRRDHRPPT